MKLDLTVKGTGLLVSDDRLWYGADLRAKRKRRREAGSDQGGSGPVRRTGRDRRLRDPSAASRRRS